MPLVGTRPGAQHRRDWAPSTTSIAMPMTISAWAAGCLSSVDVTGGYRGLLGGGR